MHDPFERRVAAAAVALWWVVLFGAVLFAASWIGYLVISPMEPSWLPSLWGPGITWDFIRQVWFWGLAGFKVMVWLLFMTALWLTLWARQLRHQ